jgi:uncharacterized membrane protein
MGTDYGHPLRLIFHTLLVLVAMVAAAPVIVWGFSKLQHGPKSLRGMMGIYGIMLGIGALCGIVWLLW